MRVNDFRWIFASMDSQSFAGKGGSLFLVVFPWAVSPSSFSIFFLYHQASSRLVSSTLVLFCLKAKAGELVRDTAAFVDDDDANDDEHGATKKQYSLGCCDGKALLGAPAIQLLCSCWSTRYHSSEGKRDECSFSSSSSSSSSSRRRCAYIYAFSKISSQSLALTAPRNYANATLLIILMRRRTSSFATLDTQFVHPLFPNFSTVRLFIYFLLFEELLLRFFCLFLKMYRVFYDTFSLTRIFIWFSVFLLVNLSNLVNYLNLLK